MAPVEPLRVFLCDDVSEFRVLMRYTLEEDPGLRVVGEAADGDRGVEGALSASADAVLVDVSMPGKVDGFEAVRRLRARAPRVGILVLSGFASERMDAAAAAAGADRYLEKGEPPESVRAAIHTVVSERRAAAA